MKALHTAIGMVIGIALTTIMFIGIHLPHDDERGAELKDANDTLTECMSTLKTTVDTTQTVIDTVNFCADMLWNLPIEDLNELRTKPQPEHLPDITTKPVVLPDAQKDAVFL